MEVISRTSNHRCSEEDESAALMHWNYSLILSYFHTGSYNVEIKTIAYDFSDTNSYDKISQQLKDMDIGVLGELFST